MTAQSQGRYLVRGGDEVELFHGTLAGLLEALDQVAIMSQRWEQATLIVDRDGAERLIRTFEYGNEITV